MKLVRAMKTYGHIRVSNAMEEIGYYLKKPHRRSTNVEYMVMGIPRIDLERILSILRRDWHKPMPSRTLTSQDFQPVRSDK